MQLNVSLKTICPPLSQTDPDVDDGRRHHDAYALEQVSHHVDEGGADAGVAVGATAEEWVGVAVDGGVALAILVNLVIAAAVSVEGGGVMEDVRHSMRGKKTWDVRIWAAATKVLVDFFYFSLIKWAFRQPKKVDPIF